MSQNHALLELVFGPPHRPNPKKRRWHLSSRPACPGSSVEENHGVVFTGKSTPETHGIFP